jgi:hypothetical protein
MAPIIVPPTMLMISGVERLAEDQAGDRLVAEEGVAEAEGRHVGDVADVLQPQRIGQAPQLLLLGDGLAGEVVVEEDGRRVARQ